MSPLVSSLISMIFLASGAISVYIMLKLQGKGGSENYRSLAAIHRYSGRVFGVLFMVMFLFMLERVESFWEETSARISIHVTLAIALFFLLLLKTIIPRYFKKLNKHLFTLGIVTYLTAFTMVWIAAGYYFIWRYEESPYIHHEKLPKRMRDVELGKHLFIDKCSVCHLLENIMQTRSKKSWEEVVNRMIELATPRIAPGEGAQILYYLTETHTPTPGPEPGEKASLIERYCLPCHVPRDIRSRTYSRTGWQELVKEMRGYAPEMIPEDKIDEIVDYLLGLQAPGQEM